MKTRIVSLLVSLTSAVALLLLLVMLLGIATLGAPVKPAEATGLFYYDFEQTLAPWAPNAHYTVSQYGSYYLARQNNDNACPANGSWYANLGLTSGNYSRAPVWMVAAYSGTVIGASNNVSISWKDKDKAGCDGLGGCASLVYVGTSAPDSYTSNWGSNEQVYGTWTPKSYTTSITLDNNNTIYVALGFRSIYIANGQQAPEQQVGFDCVSVNITVNNQPPP